MFLPTSAFPTHQRREKKKSKRRRKEEQTTRGDGRRREIEEVGKDAFAVSEKVIL